jgi:hypothetical protein
MTSVVGLQAALRRAILPPCCGDHLGAADLADTSLLPSKTRQQPGRVGGVCFAHTDSIAHMAFIYKANYLNTQGLFSLTEDQGG